MAKIGPVYLDEDPRPTDPEIKEAPPPKLSLIKEIFSKGLEEGTASYLGIPPEDIEWASSLGEKYSLNRGSADAARHVALGWLASKTPDPDLTKFFADLREFAPLGGGPVVSRRMDLANNQIGFDLGAESKEDAENRILGLIQNKQVNLDDPTGYANGGGIASLASRATSQSNIPDIRRGVATFAPYMSRRA